MKTFSFRLERVLEWRQVQLDVEQSALGRVAAEFARWETVLANLGNARAKAEGLVQSGPVDGADLGALASYQEHIEQQRKTALDRRRDCAARLEKQRARLLQARRDHRLLEKLRQVRRAEWETAVDREFEALAAETYLAQWEPPRRPNAKP
jgi:flagellar export protein FliJ